MQRQLFIASLIMVVSKHAAADSLERRVTSNEIMRKFIYEIHQIYKRLFIYFHRNMLCVYRYSVLIKIPVRRKLPKPILSAQLQRHGSERLFTAPAKPSFSRHITQLG